jgi:hypothetical protein
VAPPALVVEDVALADVAGQLVYVAIAAPFPKQSLRQSLPR